jgi:hypothetical protein
MIVTKGTFLFRHLCDGILSYAELPLVTAAHCLR